MNKLKKEKAIKSLNEEIQLLQMEKFIDDINTTMKRDFKKRFKKLAFGVGPLIVAIIGYLIFKNPLIIVVGAGFTGVGGITILTKDLIKDIKEVTPKNQTSQNVTNITEEKDIDQILQEGIGKNKGEDFYTENYKSLLQEMENHVETEQEKKYREILEKQHMKGSSSKIKPATNNEEILNKDETMVQIVKEIDSYTMAYNIPPLEITNQHWDIYFDSVYELFMKKGIESKFYAFMSQVERITLSKSLLNKERTINIYDFIDNLHYLECEEMKGNEILSLQKELLDKLPTAKIIDFSSYANSGKRK